MSAPGRWIEVDGVPVHLAPSEVEHSPAAMAAIEEVVRAARKLIPNDQAPLNPPDDPGHSGNGPEHHTGKLCIEGCGQPAGTAWSPLWCQGCNAKRIARVTAGLEAALARMEARR